MDMKWNGMEENMKWVCESEILISGGYESESRRWKKDEEIGRAHV